MSGIAGPLIGAAGSILGGLFGGGNPGYRYPGVGKFTHNQLRAYRKYGEEFGFHPLELLRAGAGLLGGGGGSGATSGVATQAAIAGTFDAIDDVLSGRSAREAAAQDVEDELRRVELQTRKAELDRMTATGGGAFRTAAAPLASSSVREMAKVPEVPVGPQVSPFRRGSVDDPVMINRVDGLPSVNPDYPVEPEEDLWGFAREGTFWQNVGEIARRNQFGVNFEDQFEIRPGSVADKVRQGGRAIMEGNVETKMPSMLSPSNYTDPFWRRFMY